MADSRDQRLAQQAEKIRRRLDAQPAQRAARAARIQEKLDRGDYVRQGSRDWLAAWRGRPQG